LHQKDCTEKDCTRKIAPKKPTGMEGFFGAMQLIVLSQNTC